MTGGQSCNRCCRLANRSVVPANDRRTLNAVLSVLCTGCAWRGRPPGSMPEKYGDDMTAHRHLRHWQAEGVRQRIHRALPGMLDRMTRIGQSAIRIAACGMIIASSRFLRG